MTTHEKYDAARQFWIAASLSLFAALAFFFSTNAKLRDLDYTSQIASALLRGHVGLTEKPPEWLNEMIPHGEPVETSLIDEAPQPAQFGQGAVLQSPVDAKRACHSSPLHVPRRTVDDAAKIRRLEELRDRHRSGDCSEEAASVRFLALQCC